ncbi:hypothetical protein Q604_UNBC10263G0001, partial [human gut metagenome]
MINININPNLSEFRIYFFLCNLKELNHSYSVIAL